MDRVVRQRMRCNIPRCMLVDMSCRRLQRRYLHLWRLRGRWYRIQCWSVDNNRLIVMHDDHHHDDYGEGGEDRCWYSNDYEHDVMWYYDLISPRHISIRTFYHWYILQCQFLYQCNVHVVLVMLTLMMMNVWQFYVMLSMLVDLYVLRYESIIFIIRYRQRWQQVGVIMFVGGIKNKKRKHTVRL